MIRVTRGVNRKVKSLRKKKLIIENKYFQIKIVFNYNNNIK